MSTLRQAAVEYLEMRRSLGYKLQRQGQMLLDFAGYLDIAGETTITTEAALAWATRPASAGPVYWQRRLSVVRGFAAHYKTLDPASEVPPAGLLPAPGGRSTPYLYSRDEIAALVHAAGILARPLQAATYQALISLLAVTGLRIGEAIRLTSGEIDLDAALITVISSKFGKSRLVPLHPDTAGMLRRYAARRDQLCPTPATRCFFVSTAGTPLHASGADAVFTRLLALAGIGTPPGRRQPRIHDLRHSMAVETLLEWYRTGADAQARLPLLSTWLGHTDPASTFWYLHTCPELMALAARRLEDSQEHAS